MLTIEDVAKRMNWWQQTKVSVANTKQMIFQIMEYGNLEDVQVMLTYFDRKTIIDALKKPLPGILTLKSWYFWHIYFEKSVPFLPKRNLNK